MSLYTTLEKTKQEMPDRLKRLQQEAEATRKMAAAQSAQTPTAGTSPSPTSGMPQMEQGRSTPSAAELAGSVRSSLVSPTKRAETISQLTKKLQASAPSPAAFTTNRLGGNQISQGVTGGHVQELLDKYQEQAEAQKGGV